MLSPLTLLSLVSQLSAQTWCNKNYLPGQPVVPPGGQFPAPELHPSPLLALRCAPIITPYLDDDDRGGILVEAFLTFARYSGAEPIASPPDPPGAATLDVSISAGSAVLTTGVLAFNATTELYFPLASLGRLRRQPFEIECAAAYAAPRALEVQRFSAATVLSYMPQPPAGSVTKRDARTGALLVKPAGGAAYEAIFPMGFYTSFDGYLDSDLSILDDLKAQGFTIVHPVPTFGDLDALKKVLDRMEELGLYLVYDMRHTYADPAALAAEVTLIKTRPNLLMWYTADEPDGTSAPPAAPRRAYAAIHALDGYHPVALALNCADYAFAAYAAAADVVMPDTYPVGIDPAWSVKYKTPCTEDFGCCGCDGCRGGLGDGARRLDDFALRLDVLGWTRARVLWAVPQAFGGEEFWTRAPTGREFAVQVLLSINHGARGIMPWLDPTPPDIKHTASALAGALTAVAHLLFSPCAAFRHLHLPAAAGGLDVGLWSAGAGTEIETLVLVANADADARAGEVRLPLSEGVEGVEVREVLNDGVRWRFGRGGQREQGLELEVEGLGWAVLVLVAHPGPGTRAVAFHAQGDEL
ncbi:hypothetical protein B0H15DRAFT_847733 [Mycena belliarum]|uniref:Uncharacterized protein n=1 Tax=Mycena belliarum TaxID=1033014 RepID=A0AAD6U186_9AGAR|nr:hypothetical protein B0H15DRAFT_847733 [Mycena belliae]